MGQVHPLQFFRDKYDDALQDEQFMEWLKKYDSQWESEYSGHIIAMHDAFVAGRDTNGR